MSHPAERLAARAFDNAPMLLGKQRARVGRNRSIATKFIASQRKLSWKAPETGTVGFVRLEGGRVDALNERLSARESLVVPGRFFGVADHFRMGFGMDEAQLTEGLKRLATTLEEM